MGRKPSMFSKNYRKELKQRKIKRTILILLLVLASGVVIFYNTELIDMGTSLVSTDKNEGNNESQEEKENLESEQLGEVELTTTKEKTSSFEIALDSGDKIIVTTEVVEGKSSIKELSGENEVKFNISPSKEKALIVDELNQNIYIVDTLKNLMNVTNPKYVASGSNEVYTKEEVLKYNPDYKWIENAQFIDETHVAYSSQLPWINEDNFKYLWIFDINENTHKGYYSIKGKSMNFGSVTENGVEVFLDNNKLIVNSEGKLVSNMK